MTVDELIKVLQEISANGKGNYEVIDLDSGRNVDPYVIDKSKVVSL